MLLFFFAVHRLNSELSKYREQNIQIYDDRGVKLLFIINHFLSIQDNCHLLSLLLLFLLTIIANNMNHVQTAPQLKADFQTIMSLLFTHSVFKYILYEQSDLGPHCLTAYMPKLILDMSIYMQHMTVFSRRLCS